MMKWQRAVKANYAQMSFVFLAFGLMVLIGCISVGNVVQKGISSTVTVALNESEKTIRAYLREPRIAFDNIYMAVAGMLDRGESQEAVYEYLTQTTYSLRMQTDGVLGFNGVYGFIRDEFIDSAGLNPGADIIPQQRPWYQMAVRSDSAEYTAPYIDTQTGIVIMSLAQELYGAGGDYYGVLALDIDITWLMEYAESLQFVKDGYGMIVNQYIYTVAHPHKEYRNIPLQELGKNYGEITDLLRMNHEVSAKRIQDTDGTEVIVYFRQLYNGWYIGVVMPVNSYYSDLYFAAFALIAIGSILMLALNLILLRLSAAKMRSEEESEAKSSFLARMSHEIRTPMNAILGMVELLLRKDLPGDAREEAASIKSAGINLLSIINDILDFSKIESGHMELNTSEYHLASLLNDVSNIIRVRITETPLMFTTEIDDNLPSVLIGDEVRLRQILLNLLSNAVKYTRKGRVSLAVGGEINDNTVVLTFTVADTGIGIRQEDLNKLFSDFTQFDTHRNRGIEGTGLGLAIARNLCRLMDGDITATSRYGEGSVFTARLPQKIAVHTPLEMKDACVRHKTEVIGIGFTAPSARILIVDDIETNLKVAEGLISPYKSKIDCCTSGVDTIRLVQDNEYDIIFMDHMMPEMDGVETTKAIRSMKSQKAQQIPIIALTANAVSGMREMFLKSGFNDYLAKPIEMSRLIEIMERWIPMEKREKADNSEKREPKEPANVFEIEGLDTARGLMMTGGSEERYLTVLYFYYRDAAERMDALRTPLDNSNLNLFVTHVHALKSASASIGASALSEQAAFLEKAGLGGDIEAIRERVDGFCTELATLTRNIKATLDSRRQAGPSTENDVIDTEAFVKLKEALKNEDVGMINAIMDELMQKPAEDDFKNKLEAVSECILMSEFGEAVGLIEGCILS